MKKHSDVVPSEYPNSGSAELVSTFSKLILCAIVLTLAGILYAIVSSPEQSYRFIVRGINVDVVQAAVREEGGKVTHRLAIINAVGAELTVEQKNALLKRTAINSIVQDRSIMGNPEYSNALEQ